MPRLEMDYEGSGIIKQEMSVQDDDFKGMVSKSDKPSQILSFGCPDRTSHTGVLPLFHVSAPPFNTVFTESQWMELEHQALIYKYMAANVPIPSNLLLPIRRAVESSRLSGFPSSLIRQTPFGFHFGNTDPEPGRCRRTDGKKWRCSRDAVQDQKYCERHINRGRNRSRKPVEDQSGHSDTSSLKRFASSASSAKVSTSVHINFQPTCPDGVSRLSKGSSGNSAVYWHNLDEPASFHKASNGGRPDSIALSWDTSMGGPLGEALNSGSSTKSDE